MNMTTENLMTVVEIIRFGPPDFLALKQSKIPSPANGLVLIGFAPC